MDYSKPEIIAIVGPSSSNKTNLAIELADILNGEIISADSRQIYSDIDIGTGKPTLQQMKRVTHHLVSSAPPEQAISAYAFQMMADAVLKKINENKHQCLVCGGTGLWIKAFCDGLSPTPPPDPEFRKNLIKSIEEEGLSKYYSRLIAQDPAIADRIKPNDKLRIIRSLEILENSELLPSEINWNTIEIKHKTLWIGCLRPRNVLYQMAEQKIDEWISSGWIDEVQGLLNRGIDASYPAMQALGYSHIAQFLNRQLSMSKMIELIKRDTRRYIKRQLTWFRADSRIHWINTDRALKDAVHEALELIRRPD